MDFNEILNNLGLFGSGILLFGMVSGVFWKVDDGFSDDFKEEVSLRLLCLDFSKTVKSWPNHFAALFDKVFGRKHLCWKRIWRSCTASIIFFYVLVLLCFIILGETAFSPWENSPEKVLFTSVFFILVNLIADYLSLVETRIIIKEMCKYDHLITIILILFIDVFLTLFIFVMTIFIASFISFGISRITHGLAVPSLSIIYYVIGKYYFKGLFDILLFKSYLPISVATYTTFITSVWIWFFALSQMLVRLTTKTLPIIERLKQILPIEERPFRSIGIVSGLIACCTYWSVGIIAKLI